MYVFPWKVTFIHLNYLLESSGHAVLWIDSCDMPVSLWNSFSQRKSILDWVQVWGIGPTKRKKKAF